MRPDPRLTSFVLAAALLAGCGSSPSPTKSVGAAPATGMTAQAAAKDASARKLIDAYRAMKGQTAAVLKQRLAVIDKLGETDSDRAAEFLSVELDRVDLEPEVAQDKLVPAIVSALSELDEDATTAPRQNHEGYALSTSEIIAAGNTVEAKKRKRRFNVWDIIRGYFKKKKRKSGGGGGAPPAPPAPPAAI